MKLTDSEYRAPQIFYDNLTKHLIMIQGQRRERYDMCKEKENAILHWAVYLVYEHEEKMSTIDKNTLNDQLKKIQLELEQLVDDAYLKCSMNGNSGWLTF